MRDLLGTAAFWNQPVANETQNIFRRFVKTPGAGLTDRLAEYRDKFSEFGKKALHTHLSEYLED
jgi:hypothetical protein